LLKNKKTPFYESFGGVLTSTMPIALTGALPDTPDAATGLVHLGGAGGTIIDPPAFPSPPFLSQMRWSFFN